MSALKSVGNRKNISHYKALGVLKYRLDRTAAENAELLRNIAKMGGGSVEGRRKRGVPILPEMRGG